jgi:AcrR family transcriptional regulator
MSTRLPTSAPRKRLTAAARREVIELAAMDVFAERGYHGAAIDEIARRSGVTPPVVYDHFESKAALHRRLLERTRDELLAMWRENLGGGDTLEQQVARGFDAWSRYVEAHPYAPRMFFRETTGIPEVRTTHREIAADANDALAEILGGLPGSTHLQAEGAPMASAMASEVERRRDLAALTRGQTLAQVLDNRNNGQDTSATPHWSPWMPEPRPWVPGCPDTAIPQRSLWRASSLCELSSSERTSRRLRIDERLVGQSATAVEDLLGASVYLGRLDTEGVRDLEDVAQARIALAALNPAVM